MLNRKLLVIFFSVLVSVASAQWSRLNDISFTPRAGVASFSFDDAFYVGTGAKGEAIYDSSGNITGAYTIVYKDFWKYDVATDTWTQVSDFPGGVRSAMVSASCGGKGYVGMSFQAGIYFNDWWEFDPALNTWQNKASFPGSVRTDASVFSIGSKVYVCNGVNGTYFNDLWEYESLTDSWTRKADFPGLGRDGSMTFVVDGKGYLGSGIHDYNPLNDYWCYDPSTDSWDSVARLPGKRLSSAATFSYDHKGYVVGGYSYYDIRTTDSVHIFDPASNSWSTIPDTVPTDLSNAYWMTHGAPAMCHSGRRYNIAFVMNGKAYTGMGMGNTDADYYKDFYEYTLPTVSTGINSLSASNATLSVSPNPGNGMYGVHFRSDKKAEIKMEVCNSTGISILKRRFSAGNSLDEKLDLRSFSPGVYYLRVMQDGKSYSEKIVVK